MRCLIVALLLLAANAFAQTNNQFTIAAYNVENWNSIERNKKPNQPKPRAEKEAVVNLIATIRPDVLALEEMGKQTDFAEFAAALRDKGLAYADQEWIEGTDPDRHVCLLSRFPITQRFSRVDYTYLLDGKPTRISRGLLDVMIQVNAHYSFRAVVAHLKSKRQSTYGDQATMRLEEARLLRAHIGKILKEAPEQNLIALGDFNDTPDSPPLHAIIGVPPFQLFALRPLDSAGTDATHYWKARREFSRIDYLILSPGMSNEYVIGSAQIADLEGWDKASDHRMVYASFLDHDAGSAATNSSHILIVVGAGLVVLLIVLGMLYQRRRR